VRHVVRHVERLQPLEHRIVFVREQLLDHQRISCVVARLRDPDMKQTIARMRERPALVVFLVAQERVANPLDLRVRAVLRGERRRLRLDQAARLQQRERRDLGVEVERDAELRIDLDDRERRDLRGGKRLRRGSGLALAHLHAVADAHADEPVDLERDQRLAHRRARHAEPLGQFALGRQVAARREIAGLDHRTELVGDLLVQAAVLNRLDGHTSIRMSGCFAHGPTHRAPGRARLFYMPAIASPGTA
jgi:hypothetical protein